MSWLLLLVNVILLTAGQVTWKKAIQALGGLTIRNLPELLMSPLFLVGGIYYAAATLTWLYVISRLPLSAAYPLQSLAYVIGIIAAWKIFGESIPGSRWVGVGIIVIGVVVISVK